MYFTLKDTQAQIKAVMFRSAIRYLRFKPQDGLRVVARGRLTVYDPKGEYQIVCEHLEPEGLGARQLAFDQLKERLAREGLFDPRRKRALPALPRKIGSSRRSTAQRCATSSRSFADATRMRTS
jgi:exodeoxyribonuclease VII large subunit